MLLSKTRLIGIEKNIKKFMNGRREMRNHVTITNGGGLPPNTNILLTVSNVLE